MDVSVYSSVYKALRGCFPDIPIVDGVALLQEEGLPYITVLSRRLEHICDGNDRARRIYSYRITYHPDRSQLGDNDHLERLQEQLISCLHRIEDSTGPLVAGTVWCEIEQQLLHCHTEYPVHLKTVPERFAQMHRLVISETFKEE